MCRKTMPEPTQDEFDDAPTQVQFAGVTVTEGDEIQAVYDDKQGCEVEETMTIRKISHVNDMIMDTHLEAEDRSKFDVTESRVHEIEVL